MTRRPRLPASIAHIIPAAPAPMMATSLQILLTVLMTNLIHSRMIEKSRDGNQKRIIIRDSILYIIEILLLSCALQLECIKIPAIIFPKKRYH